MRALKQHESICQAFADPEFYPHPVSQLERRDTHISAVFLTGRWVYKLKKPLDLGFLDFRSLESRRRFCELEIHLNKRLSKGVYHSVVPIYRTDDKRFTFEKRKTPVDYAVKMRQLPDEACLAVRLRKDRLKPYHLKKLGFRMADFYAAGERGRHIDRFGQLKTIAQNMNENFEQLAPFAGNLFEQEKWDLVCHVCRSFFKHRSALFKNRVHAGRIRDGHGDLRTDHIYFYRGLQIIDCIEFNDRFRYGDVASDLAFLHMDLAHLGFQEWSQIFLGAYVDHADDPHLYALIDFYATYRAIVRLKVSCLRFADASPAEQEHIKTDIALYLDQAYQYAVMFSRPTLWVFCGLPATGKSSLAAQTAASIFSPLLSSDQIRKVYFSSSHPQVSAFGKGIYRKDLRQRVYSLLLGKAQEKLKEGRSIVLDATFSRRRWRDTVCRLAEDLDIDIIFIECRCSRKTMRARLAEREITGGPSDARLQHLGAMFKNFEPVNELPEDRHLVIQTGKPIKTCLIKILSRGYTCKANQVKKRLWNLSRS